MKRILTGIAIATVVAATVVPSALATRVDQNSGGAAAPAANIRVSPPAGKVSQPGTVTSFHWGDVGIGAGSALGLVLLMSLGAALVQQNRKGPLTA